MKKLLALILVVLLSLTLLCGCKDEIHTPAETLPAETTVPVTEVQADYEEVYKEILESNYSFIVDKDETEPSSGQSGVAEAIMTLDTDAALGAVGYMFKDLTGDGFAELIIGSAGEGEDVKTPVFSVYTIAFDMPLLLAEGSSKNSYFLLDDGTFLYEGANGAAGVGVGIFRMSQGGTSLICNEFYFTEPYEADPSVILVYKNNTGKWNTERSEITEMTIEDVEQIRTDYEEKLVYLELTAFSEYNK